MSAARAIKSPVSERALLARINRKLAAKGERDRMHKAPDRWANSIGRYFIGQTGGVISRQHCDIEKVARELGVMQPFEKLED